MKISATIRDSVQISEDGFQERRKTYLFDESATIAQILKATGMDDISMCNLAMVKESE